MGHWGVKSYENDDTDDALDGGFEEVHGDLYEELMDDRNPLPSGTGSETPRQCPDPGRGGGDPGGNGRLPAGKSSGLG